MLLMLVSRLIVRLLAVILLICTAAATLGGRALSSDESWLHFGFDFCALPCFAGITPGQTPFNNAPGLIMHHIQSVDPRTIMGGASINFWAQSKTQLLSGLIRYDNGVVGEMHFSVILPLAELIAELGTPDCVLPNTDNAPARVPVIFWERDQVSIAAVLDSDPEALRLSANTNAIWLNAIQVNDCSRSGAVRWRGFAPLWDYAQ
jgi:hypothetical protein